MNFVDLVPLKHALGGSHLAGPHPLLLGLDGGAEGIGNGEADEGSTLGINRQHGGHFTPGTGLCQPRGGTANRFGRDCPPPCSVGVSTLD